jgi:hypothetical protein
MRKIGAAALGAGFETELVVQKKTLHTHLAVGPLVPTKLTFKM